MRMTIRTTNEPHRSGRLAVVSDLGRQLVRQRCHEQLVREHLGRAIRTESRRGASIDSLSEASGLRPDEVKKIMQSEDCEENLSILVGIG